KQGDGFAIAHGLSDEGVLGLSWHGRRLFGFPLFPALLMVICQCSNLGDAVAADATFRRTQELHADIANLETDLLAGLAISPWFTYRREEAIPHYRARIAAG